MLHVETPRSHAQAQGPRRTRPRCVTLAELVVVIVIVGILLAVGVTAFSGTTANRQIEAAADRITSDLSLARQHAITTGASQSVQFAPGSGGYVLPGLQDPDRPSNTYAIDLSGSPYGVAIQSADFDGDAEIVFDAYGTPDSGGTLVIGAGGRQITLSVDADTGRVSRS